MPNKSPNHSFIRFFGLRFSADPKRGEIKKMQKRRKTSRRRTNVRQRRFSAVEKADNHSLGEIR